MFVYKPKSTLSITIHIFCENMECPASCQKAWLRRPTKISAPPVRVRLGLLGRSFASEAGKSRPSHGCGKLY